MDDIPDSHRHYPDALIRRVLGSARTIAVVGASPRWIRPSYFAMKYMQVKGYRMIPVNPQAVGEEILGETVYASLKDIPEAIDIVDIFRASETVGPIVEDAIEIGAKCVWMQLGVFNAEAAARAESSGLTVIIDRCVKIEFGRLSGELGWCGVDTGIISSKRFRALG